ncbi:MAG: hypothetical protein ACOCUS_03930, partial [Polyangiales bacterium]
MSREAASAAELTYLVEREASGAIGSAVFSGVREGLVGVGFERGTGSWALALRQDGAIAVEDFRPGGTLGGAPVWGRRTTASFHIVNFADDTTTRTLRWGNPWMGVDLLEVDPEARWGSAGIRVW